MDYFCTADVYYSPTTRILHLTSLWWYTARHCWWFPSPPPESLPVERISLSNISNKHISLPLHLSKNEKSICTELIMFQQTELNSTCTTARFFNLLLSKAAIRTRTENLLIRNQLLYPIELRQLILYLVTAHCSKAAVFTWNRLTKNFGEKNHLENSQTQEIAVTGVEPVILWVWAIRDYPFHSTATPHGGFEPPSRFRPNG